MDSTKSRMIAVVALVCLFAVSMATLLNYFKYRTTSERLVHARLVVIGKSIENSVQASLALGLSFTNIRTLTDLMERERDADELVYGIEVFSAEGRVLYSTDRLRVGRSVSSAWLSAVHQSGDADWVVPEGNEGAVGVSLKNSFGLTEGYLALRYSREKIDAEARRVAKSLVISALLVLLTASALGATAIAYSVRRIEREMLGIEESLRTPGIGKPTGSITRSMFGQALGSFLESVRTAENHIAAVRGKLKREAER